MRKKIIVTLSKVMKNRGVSLGELSDAVGITMANLSILKTGKAKAIRFETLQKLCTVLECTPGDIIQVQ